MKKTLTFLLICLTLITSAQTGMLNGSGYAPDITVADINGNTHNLYNYLDSGKVVVLELMSVTCGHCQAHAAGTENSYQTNGPNGNNSAIFIGLEINAATDDTAVINFINNFGASFPIANDISPGLINYEITYTPTYYVIYPDRSYITICANCITPTTSSTIEGLLDNAIASWPPVLGCTDATATNFDPLATTDDGNCNFTSYTIKTLGMTFSPDTIVCDVGDTINFVLGGSHNAVEVDYFTFVSGGNISNGGFGFGYGATGMYIPNSAQTYYYVCQPHVSSGMIGVIIANLYGCTDPTALNYDSTATIDDGSCISVVYGCTGPTYCNYDANATMDDGSCWGMSGCTDLLADNYEPIANCDDGTCTYSVCDAKPTGLNAYDITDTRFRLGWDNMNTTNCMVLKYNVRYRVTGTTTWTTKAAGAGNGLCVFGLNNVEKLMINFMPSTTYDVRLRAQYCDNPTAWSAWTSTVLVMTANACPDLTNVQVQTFNGQQNKAKFTWDTTGVYEFARLYTRVNGGTAPYNWTIQGGFGIYYPTFFKNIFTFTPGETYRVQANSFCSATMTSYKGNLTPPVIWTQPGSVRLEGGTTIANLEVYPNPSRDVFNVTFTSEDVQDLRVRILNVVGEELVNEDLQQFIGEYTKQIDLSNNAKGIYFLEIKTNDGVINKKLILQ